MFTRRERLPRAVFPDALRAGRRLQSAHFTAILPKEAKGYAVVVSKKVARLSITRHRIKRRFLEALRKLTLPPALIIFPKPTANCVSYQDIKAELSDLLSKIHK